MAGKKHSYLADGSEAWSCSDCGGKVPKSDLTCGHCGAHFPEVTTTTTSAEAVGKSSDLHSANMTYRFAFHGNGGDLFLLYLKNAALTLITLGIYSAWAKAALYRYFYGRLEAGGSRMRFHGTGNEIFRGIALIGGLSVLFMIFQGVMEAVFTFLHLPSLITGLFSLAVFIGILFLVQLAIFGALRYRLGRTSLREIRFRLTGLPMEFAKQAVVHAILVGLTLGFWFPVYQHWKTQILVGQMRYGSLAFRFDAPSRDYVRLAYKGFFLSVMTLGIYWFFFYPKWVAFKRGHTWLGQSRFRCEFKVGEFTSLTLINLALLVFTLGWGAPWVLTRHTRFIADHSSLTGPTRIEEALQGEAQNLGSSGLALADNLDAGSGIDFGL